jgi:hypothetical protein
MTRRRYARLHLFQKWPRDKKMQPGLRKAGPTCVRGKLHEEDLMDSNLGASLVGVSVFLVPNVGSIALFSFLGVATWSDARRKEREAYYRSETLKKIAESSGEGAKSALELLREQEKNFVKRRLEGMKIGGLVTAAIGIGVMVLLRGLVHDEPVYLSGLIPLLIGVALLIYPLLLAPRAQE